MKRINQQLQHHALLDLVLVVVGAVTTLAFSPFNVWAFAFICPAILFHFWTISTAKRAYMQGLLFGLGFFGTSISWVFISMHRFGGMNLFTAGLATLLLVIVVTQFIAVNGWVVNALFKANTYVRLLMVYPVSWVLFEWLRSYIFTGFPWVFLGYSQLNTPLAGFAPIASVYAVSFGCVMISACLIGIFYPNRVRWPSLAIILLILGTGYGASTRHWTKRTDKSIPVRVVQGNIAQQLKWDPNQLIANLMTYDQLMLSNLTPNTLMIWPENAIPAFQFQVQPYIKSLTQTLNTHKMGLITGIPLIGSNDSIYYNGARGLGLAAGLYKKHHLVPFGEYIPLKATFGPLLNILDVKMSSFSGGPIVQSLFSFQGVNIALFICYESAYPEQVRQALQDAGFIITLSDDAWFGASIGPKQHAQMNQMRALETGRFIINATNNGVTDIVSPKGRVMISLPQFTRGVLHGKVTVYQGETPWVRYGLTPLFSLFFILLVLAWVIMPPTFRTEKNSS